MSMIKAVKQKVVRQRRRYGPGASSCLNDADQEGGVAKDHKLSTRQILLRVRSIPMVLLICLACLHYIFVPIVVPVSKVVALVIERNYIMPNACQVAYDSKLFLAKEDASKPGLPKIIHQVWKDDEIPPGRFADVHAAWKRLYPEPEYQHILWTDETGRNLIDEEFNWFLETYDSYPMNIQRADAMRYFILYKYGGVYADLDYEPLVNFWDYLSKERVSLIESPYILNERVQNSLMASPPGHPFWNASFSILQDHAQDDSLLASTGPAAMDATMDVYSDTSDGVYVLACQNFQRIPVGGIEFRQRSFVAQWDHWRRFYTKEVKSCGDWTRTNDCQFGIHHNAVSYDAELIQHNEEVEKKKKLEREAEEAAKLAAKAQASRAS